jgi:hypothetical protein
MVSVKLSAQDLFRAAYENRYTWDQDFPGYTADVTYKQGDRCFTGRIEVSAKLKTEVLEIEDEEARQAIQEQLQEIAIHRVRRSFEDTHGKNVFSYGETDETGAVEIFVGGKSQGDHYKVRNNEVCKVHRHIHGIVVTINTFASQDTGEGYLPMHYDSIYHDPQTGEKKSEQIQFEDAYEKAGNYFVLSHRIIRTEIAGEPHTQEYVFSNLQPLPTA